MITKNNLPTQLKTNTTQDLLDIVVKFTNTFHDLYHTIIDEQTILKKLETVNCICFDNSPMNKIILDKNCNASWTASDHQITISAKYQGNSTKELKLLIYHELMHVLTERTVTNQENNYQNPVDKTGEIFDEIMTEYYANQLLEKEKNHIGGTYMLKNEMQQDFLVHYDGMAYQEYGQLGAIYNLFFGDQLLRARLFAEEEQKFIHDFNLLFCHTDFNQNHATDNIPYINFINETNPLKRFDVALNMLSTLINHQGFKKHLKEINLTQKEFIKKFGKLLPTDKNNIFDKKLNHALLQNNFNTQLKLEQTKQLA